MKVKLIFSMALINYSVNAMDLQQNKPLPQLSSDVLYTHIFVPEKIVEQENSSVKNAREDLYALSLVNKQLHKTVTKKLNDSQFTEFFIDTLAEKKILDGNKLAIAAYLGTIPSVGFIKKYLNLNRNLETSEQKKLALFNTIIQIDTLPENHYLLNTHKLLWNLLILMIHKRVELSDLPNPQLFKREDFFYEEKFEIKKLKNNTQISKYILNLFLKNDISVSVDCAKQTPLMRCCIAHRTDLLSLVYDKETLNYQDCEGNTALMHATKNALNAAIDEPNNANKLNKSIESLEFILSKKPDFSLKNKDDLSVLDIVSMFQRNNKKRKFDIKKLNMYHYVQNIVNTILQGKKAIYEK